MIITEDVKDLKDLTQHYEYLDILKNKFDIPISVSYMAKHKMMLVIDNQALHAVKRINGLDIVLEHGFLFPEEVTSSELNDQLQLYLFDKIYLFFNIMKELPVIKCRKEYYYNLANKKEYFLITYMIGSTIKFKQKTKHLLITNIPELDKYHNFMYNDNEDENTVLSLKNIEEFEKEFRSKILEFYLFKNPDSNEDEFKIKEIEVY